jgi:transposase
VVEKVFPNAVVVIDRFHVMKAVNEELNKIRRQANILDRGSKFILLKNGQDLTPEQAEKLDQLLRRSKRLEKAYRWKELFRAIYEQPLTVEEGKHQLTEWLDKARSVYSEVITTIHNHLDGILQLFSKLNDQWSNGGNQSSIKRQAYGFVNFNNFRERLLARFSD